MFRRGLLVVCVVALAHAAFYIWYQWPHDRDAWTDQAGYRQLGTVLATTGRFTRYPDAPTFVPEVIRTPGYPAFVAAVYLLSGVGNDLAVLVAQAFAFCAICVMVFAITRRVADLRTAHYAALAAALFSPLPYFGSLVLTELFTGLVLTLAAYVCLRAIDNGRLRTYVLAGVLFSATTLVRPAFVLLPFFLAGACPVLIRTHRTRRHLTGWAALALAAALTLVPWFTYNYVYLGAFTLSPAGGIGRGLWEGAWQGRWPGRVQAELTALAGEPTDDATLNTRVSAVAQRERLDAREMLTYVHQWRDIRAIWESPHEPMERARARVVADNEYRRAAIAEITADPVGHVTRRLTRGLFILWAGEIPIRYRDINAMPVLAIRLIWAIQVLLVVAAVAGLMTLARRGRWPQAVVLGLAFIYVTGVHVPLLCEARQTLPVKPLLIVAAAVGAAGVRRRSLPSEAQVHEREHVGHPLA